MKEVSLSRLRRYLSLLSRDGRRSYLAYRYIKSGQNVVSVDCGGFSLLVDLRDEGVGLPLFLGKHYEHIETGFVRSNLREGDVVCDVGANVGYYTIIASKRVGMTGRVVAIEPDPHNFALLSRNVEANGMTNVLLVNSALGAASSRGRLQKSTSNFGDHCLYPRAAVEGRTGVDVEVETLAGVLQRLDIAHVDFIKMDVQGYEGHVQAGMETVLASGSPRAVLTEFWPKGLQMAGTLPETFFNRFLQFGYQAMLLTPSGDLVRISYDEVLNQLRPVGHEEPDDAHVNLVFAKGTL
jgi:FkbM family methyltransferase